MNLIVAVDQNWGIGKGNDLLFHIPEDMKFFRNMTTGKIVVCGMKTLKSFPGSKPLPNRHHFVITSSDTPSAEMLTVVHSIEELLEKLAAFPEDEIFVIGGASVYRQLLPLCKTAYVTRIEALDPEADVFFPNLDEVPYFRLAEKGATQESKNGLRFSFDRYENIG